MQQYSTICNGFYTIFYRKSKKVIQIESLFLKLFLTEWENQKWGTEKPQKFTN